MIYSFFGNDSSPGIEHFDWHMEGIIYVGPTQIIIFQEIANQLIQAFELFGRAYVAMGQHSVSTKITNVCMKSVTLFVVQGSYKLDLWQTWRLHSIKFMNLYY